MIKLKIKSKKITVAIATLLAIGFYGDAVAAEINTSINPGNLIISEIFGPGPGANYSQHNFENSTSPVSMSGLYVNNTLGYINSSSLNGLIPPPIPNKPIPVVHTNPYSFGYYTTTNFYMPLGHFGYHNSSYTTTPTSVTVGTHSSELVYSSMQDAQNTMSRYIDSYLSTVINDDIIPQLGNVNHSSINPGNNLAIFDITVPVIIRTPVPGSASPTNNNPNGRNTGGVICITPTFCIPQSSGFNSGGYYHGGLSPSNYNITSNTYHTSNVSFNPGIVYNGGGGFYPYSGYQPTTPVVTQPTQYTYSKITLQDTVTIWPNGSFQQTGFNQVTNGAIANNVNVLIVTYYEGEYNYQLPLFLSNQTSSNNAGKLSYELFSVPVLANGQPETPIIGTNGASYASTATPINGNDINYINLDNNGGFIGHYGSYDSMQLVQSQTSNGSPLSVLLNCASISNGKCLTYQAGSYAYSQGGSVSYTNTTPVEALAQQQILPLMKKYNATAAFVNYQLSVNSFQQIQIGNNSYANSNNTFPDVNTVISNRVYNHQCGQPDASISGTTSNSFNLLSMTNVFRVNSSGNAAQYQTGIQNEFIDGPYTYNYSGSIPKSVNACGLGYLGAANQLSSRNLVMIKGSGSGASIIDPETNLTNVWLNVGNLSGGDSGLNGNIYPLTVIPGVSFNGSVSGVNQHNVPYQSCTTNSNGKTVCVTLYKCESFPICG